MINHTYYTNQSNKCIGKMPLVETLPENLLSFPTVFSSSALQRLLARFKHRLVCTAVAQRIVQNLKIGVRVKIINLS